MPLSTTTEPAPAIAGSGLYRLKPWYAARLAPVLGVLDRLSVSPDALSFAGILAAGLGGVALALLPTGPLCAVLVLAAGAVRLACANLDGNLARRRGVSRRFGSVVNELGDRLGDLALLAGLTAHLSGALGLGMLLAATAPSWVAIAVAAAGGRRRNGGPMGKTERAALCVVAALTGWWVVVGAVITIGSVVTALVRLRSGARELAAHA